MLQVKSRLSLRSLFFVEMMAIVSENLVSVIVLECPIEVVQLKQYKLAKITYCNSKAQELCHFSEFFIERGEDG